jgi:hypothetical protein
MTNYLPNFLLILNALGGCTSSTLQFILPSLFYIQSFGRDYLGDLIVGFNVFVIIFGVFGALYSIFISAYYLFNPY